ncbi:protease modulator HflC [Martelella soudanensis]|uniref:protease modulator HflC n=1 Tax=unclassified Martelella TaxID=2629616 RepID=UPI0015DE2270|nr:MULTISPECIES: protease modulator HflC [unclassified Martelella]
MSSNRILAVLAVIAALLLLVYASIFIVNPREQALVIRFGEIKEVRSEPGIYFKLPFSFIGADKVQYVSNQDMRFDLDDIRVQVSGGKFYEVNAFVVYRITDPERFRQAVSGDREVAVSRLRTRLDSSLRRVYGLRDFQAALSSERASMMQEVGDQLRPAAESLGLSVVDVRIRRTDLTKEVSDETYARMKSERLAEAEATRADGRERAEIRRAAADREVIEIQSAANRDSSLLRGEGDAERNRILGEAYGKDPEFFYFYRSMNAYKDVLGENSTMVLSPDSEFFEYFQTSGTGDLPPSPALSNPPPAQDAPQQGN